MGRFIYEDGQKAEIEDRALLHLQLVMTTKLRRGEPFAFTWKEDISTGGGRRTVWVNAGSSLVFKYFGSRQPAINREWVDALARMANSPGGLYLVPEPAAIPESVSEPSSAAASVAKRMPSRGPAVSSAL